MDYVLLTFFNRMLAHPVLDVLMVGLTYGLRHLALGIEQEILLLLPGQVTDIPTDAVHGQESFVRFGLMEAFERAPEFAAGETQLKYKRMSHFARPFQRVH